MQASAGFGQLPPQTPVAGTRPPHDGWQKHAPDAVVTQVSDGLGQVPEQTAPATLDPQGDWIGWQLQPVPEGSSAQVSVAFGHAPPH